MYNTNILDWLRGNNIYLSLAILLVLSLPIQGFSQAIGESQINSLYQSIYDTLKLVGPLFAVLYISFSAVQVFTDSDNPNKKSKLINAVIVTAVALIILFGAPTLVDQLKNVASGQ